MSLICSSLSDGHFLLLLRSMVETAGVGMPTDVCGAIGGRREEGNTTLETLFFAMMRGLRSLHCT